MKETKICRGNLSAIVPRGEVLVVALYFSRCCYLATLNRLKPTADLAVVRCKWKQEEVVLLGAIPGQFSLPRSGIWYVFFVCLLISRPLSE